MILSRIIGSAKYQSARDLAIPCLLPAFVDDCWSRAHLGAVNLSELERIHGIPPLLGCIISVTGVSMSERQIISDQIAELGGKYAADLTAACTHLLCPEGARQEAKSAKLEYAQKWHIPIVSRRWLESCREAQGYREPAEFLVCTPSTAPSAWHEDDLTVEEVNRIARTSNIPSYLEGCHIFLSDGGHQRLALLRRLIVVAGGTRYSDSALSDDTRLTHYIAAGQTLSPAECVRLRSLKPTPAIVHEQWLVACFIAKDRVPLEGYQMHLSAVEEEVASVDKENTLWSLGTKRNSLGLRASSQTTRLATSQAGFLSGVSFTLHTAHDWTAAVISAGGTISEASADYVVVENICQAHCDKQVNEHWLKACLAQKEVLPLDIHFQPIIAEAGQSWPQLCICTTGLSPVVRDWLKELVIRVGGQFTENLTRSNTHLLTLPDRAEGAKALWAQRNALPILHYQWLLESISSNSLQPFDAYEVSARPSKQPSQSSAKRTVMPSLVTVASPLRAEVNQRIAQVCEQLPSTQAILEQGGAETALLTPGTATLAEADAMQVLRTLLHGLVFAISQRLWHRREELHDEVVSMGGTFVWSYDPSCTHYLHQGNQVDEPFREFKLAKAQGKWIVSPAWLEECKRARRRLAETEYPHHYGTTRSQAASLSESSLPTLTMPVQATVSVPRSRKPIRYEPKVVIPEHIRPASLLAPETLPVAKCFALGGMTPNEKVRISKLLQERHSHSTILLADPEDGSVEPMSFSHLLWGSGPLTKSEKLMTAMAAGKWILNAEYAEADPHSSEIPFELKPSFGDDPIQQAWKQAAMRWRLRKQETGQGAFAGWRVRLLMVSGRKKEGLVRILLAGDGEIVEDACVDATHVLYTPANQRPKEKLPESVTVHSVELIADHLLS